MVWRQMRESLFHVMLFFVNDPATTEIYSLSLHDALPISIRGLPHQYSTLEASRNTVIGSRSPILGPVTRGCVRVASCVQRDRKSTRLNSSHANISYAVFCLKHKSEFHSLHYLVTLLLI